MTVLSKELFPQISFYDSISYSCYEVAHPWTPNCTLAFLHTIRDSFKFSLKVYLIFYMVTKCGKLRKKENRSRKELIKFLREVFQSAVFLSANGSLFIGSFCVLRSVFGKFYGWHGLLAGAFTGYMSILLERKSRRAALALYLSNLATETLFRMGVSRGIINPISNGEVLIFCLASAGFMSLYRTPMALSESFRTPFAFLVGKSEASTQQIPLHEPRRLWRRLKELTPKHPTCKHAEGCFYYVFQGACNQFAVGYLIELLLNCLKLFGRSSKAKFSNLFKSFSLACFLGGYSFLFRACNCILRWIFNKDNRAVFGGVSGAIAGLASWFHKSTSISLFALFKLLEELMFKAVALGYLPYIPNMDTYLYAASLSLILHVACIEPHNMRPGYWMFISNVSGGKFPGMFRILLDQFGTTASKLYPNFIPPLDPKYVTSPDVAKVLIASGKYTKDQFRL